VIVQEESQLEIHVSTLLAKFFIESYIYYVLCMSHL